MLRIAGLGFEISKAIGHEGEHVLSSHSKSTTALIALFLLGCTLPAMANKLVGHEYAIDNLYRATTRTDFMGESPGLFWDNEHEEMVLEPAQPPSDELDPCCQPPPPRHRARYTSPAVHADFAFHELIPSWNIRLDEKTQGYRVWIRVADSSKRWSPWFYFGSAGTRVPGKGEKHCVKSKAWGFVDTDYLVLQNPAEYFQYQVELDSSGSRKPLGDRRVALKRFFVSYSNTNGDKQQWQLWEQKRGPVPNDWSTTIAVPYRDQRDVPDKKLGDIICSPTCLAMILEAFGVNRPTLAVAAAALDVENRGYGTWPRASQAAMHFGFEAWVDRFRTHDDVKRIIAHGLPIMASIRAEKGELTTPRYKEIRGHLILIRGLTKDGEYVVNDPWSVGPTGAETVFTKDELEKIWFNKGGVGIVVQRPKPAQPSPAQ